MRIRHNADLQTTQIGITSTPAPISLETFGYQRKQRPKARGYWINWQLEETYTFACFPIFLLNNAPSQNVTKLSQTQKHLYWFHTPDINKIYVNEMHACW